MRGVLLFVLYSLFGIFVSGCVAPEGKGIVSGQIFILNCNEGDDYGTSSQKAFFDLRADFFTGEVIHDERVFAEQNRLDIRLQKGTGQLGDADLLFIQIPNVKKAGEYFIKSKPIPVYPSGDVRASLSLYLTCPSFYDGPEAVSDATELCPELTSQEVEELCNNVTYGKLNNKYKPQFPFSEGHSCLILCDLGKLKRGQQVPSDFRVGYNEVVSGIYFFSLRSRRYTEEESQRAGGFVQGNFWIKIIRAKAVQTFP